MSSCVTSQYFFCLDHELNFQTLTLNLDIFFGGGGDIKIRSIGTTPYVDDGHHIHSYTGTELMSHNCDLVTWAIYQASIAHLVRIFTCAAAGTSDIYLYLML